MEKCYKYKCLNCSNKLRKNGKHKNGKQRWQCVTCKKSIIKKRDDKLRLSELKAFVNWILKKQTISESICKSRSTAWRKTSWCWDIKPSIDQIKYNPSSIIVDAVYIGRNTCCLIARTKEFVIDYQWARSESYDAWFTFLSRIPEPKFVVSDGHQSIRKAVITVYKQAAIQRCLFHILLFSKSKLSLNPKTEAGFYLLKLVRELVHIKSKYKAKRWVTSYNEWEEKYKDFLKERSSYTDKITGKKKWFYKHKNIRSVRHHIRNALYNDNLFQFLGRDIPFTSNLLEGGVNARLKELRRCHRGVSLDKQKRIFEWYLWSRSEDKNRSNLI
jgi:transposase-like protein